VEPELDVALAVRLEGGPVAVELVAVGFDDELAVFPEEVNDVAAHGCVDLRA
jgi:hypothetical protein